jgi:cell division transport system ATP-binding protein
MITLVREVGNLLFQFKKIHKAYGIQKIFREMDFSLQRGTFSILTGPSGSGKTTLFRMLCGIEKPNQGEIVFLGRKLAEHSPIHLKNIGFIFQSPRGLFEKTVYDNIALPLVIDKMPPSDIEARVMEWLNLLGLRPRAKSLYRELSGGEIQKVEFARAMIRQPRLILADEPTAHLDQAQADLLLDILWEHYKNGATVFISTHHPPKFHHPLILRYHVEDLKIRQLSNDEVVMPSFRSDNSLNETVGPKS